MRPWAGRVSAAEATPSVLPAGGNVSSVKGASGWHSSVATPLWQWTGGCLGLASLALQCGLGIPTWPLSYCSSCSSHSIQVLFVCVENSYTCSEIQIKFPSPAICASLPSQGSTVPPPYLILGFTFIPWK